MSYDESYTADVQAMAVVHGAGLPGAARNAEASLSGLHKDMPELVSSSIDLLSQSGIDVGASKATSHRLTDALMREVAVRPEGRLDNIDRMNVTRDALRSVLVQEAAAHEYEARTGRMDSYRQWMGDRSTSNGVKAMERLEKQGVDTVALYGQASDQELTQMSVGAFNRATPAQQERIARALDVQALDIASRSAEAPAIAAEARGVVQRRPLPTRGAVTRHPHGDMRKPAPVFGRRTSPGLAVAGQGI